MTRKLTGTALWLILLLTLTHHVCYANPNVIVAPAWWIQEVKMVCEVYHVDPNLALAVAETESSCRGHQFRFGAMGKGTYYGPFGIRRCFLDKWDIADPWVNTFIGIRALALHLHRHGNLRAALRRYNTEPQGFEAYYRRIRWLTRRNEREGVFK